MLPSTSTQADLAVDVSGLNRLRSLAQRDKSGALDQAAKQFEALFINMLLKSANKASLGDPLFGSDTMNTYKDMFNQQLALQMAQTGSTGIGQMLVNQLQGVVTGTAPSGASASAKGADSSSAAETGTHNSAIRRYLGPSVQIRTHTPKASSAAETAKGSDAASVFASPSDFIEKLRPHAEAAAKELGVNPKVILAQAALETGWGQHISRDGQGKSSHNLFNIKASPDWSGKTLSLKSLEFVNGGFIKQKSTFRSYDDFAQSFQDYVDFLKSNPRYGDAIAQADSASGFTKALQDAGYATDPEYAGKISRVLNSSAMSEAFGKLKFSQSGTLPTRDG